MTATLPTLNKFEKSILSLAGHPQEMRANFHRGCPSSSPAPCIDEVRLGCSSGHQTPDAFAAPLRLFPSCELEGNPGCLSGLGPCVSAIDGEHERYPLLSRVLPDERGIRRGSATFPFFPSQRGRGGPGYFRGHCGLCFRRQGASPILALETARTVCSSILRSIGWNKFRSRAAATPTAANKTQA